MAYHINDQSISLTDLRSRIESTDLVPSRETLKIGMAEKFECLQHVGIHNLKELRIELKTNPKLKNLANKCAIEEDYLVLLRREIEGYFPKPFAIDQFDIPMDVSANIHGRGYKDSAQFQEATDSAEKIERLVGETGLDRREIHELACLCNLTRVQWTSPMAARMLYECGIHNPEELADADADKLCEMLDTVNTMHRYFKGKIGLRDVKRLVLAAAYVC